MRSLIILSMLLFRIAAGARTPVQQHLQPDEVAARPWPTHIPGRNNASYGPVTPVQEQLFEIEFLEVAPYPVISNNIFYICIYGRFYRDHAVNLTEEMLANATLTISFNITYVDGAFDSFKPLTIPMAPTALSRWNHIDIRNTTGTHKQHMVLGGNDIVSDGVIIRQFVVAGNWTMEFDARIPDGRCLFDFSMTQWVDGDYHPRDADDRTWLTQAFTDSGLDIGAMAREAA